MLSPALPGLFFAFAGMTLLLFASVSSPVWEQVYFLKAVAAGQETRWGVFGSCVVGGACSTGTLGYNFSLPNVRYVAPACRADRQRKHQHDPAPQPVHLPDPDPHRGRARPVLAHLWPPRLGPRIARNDSPDGPRSCPRRIRLPRRIRDRDRPLHSRPRQDPQRRLPRRTRKRKLARRRRSRSPVHRLLHFPLRRLWPLLVWPLCWREGECRRSISLVLTPVLMSSIKPSSTSQPLLIRPE